MKLNGMFLMLTSTLIGMTLSMPSNADYAFQGGFYSTDPMKDMPLTLLYNRIGTHIR